MKEIRLHGLGGLGTVKAGEILVHAAVMDGRYGNSIPFFGFERQGAPVVSYVRLDDKPIRPKNQVYNPNCIIVLEPTVMNAVDVFQGLKPDSVVIINTTDKDTKKLELPSSVKTVALIDATRIALEVTGRPITNTIMLAAFAKATDWVGEEFLRARIEELFGKANALAFEKGLGETLLIELD